MKNRQILGPQRFSGFQKIIPSFSSNECQKIRSDKKFLMPSNFKIETSVQIPMNWALPEVGKNRILYQNRAIQTIFTSIITFWISNWMLRVFIYDYYRCIV